MPSSPTQLVNDDPEILVFTHEDLSLAHEDLNVDVEVRVDGQRWSATFFTVKNIRSVMARYATSGECADGAYFWASDMVVVNEISAAAIRTVVLDLLDNEEIADAFGRLGD